MIKLYVILSIAVLLAFSAGGAKGVSDTLQFHYSSSVFVEKDANYWNPSISWKNKYTDWDNGDKSAKFPLSTSVLVAFTDGWHLSQLIEHLAWCLCAVVLSLCMSIASIAWFTNENLDKFWTWLMNLNSFMFFLITVTALYIAYVSGFSVFYDWLLVCKTVLN